MGKRSEGFQAQTDKDTKFHNQIDSGEVQLPSAANLLIRQEGMAKIFTFRTWGEGKSKGKLFPP